MKQFTFGSLFSGIGGLDLGLKKAGMTCLWQIEKDPFRRAILAKHWPNIKRYNDITEVNANELKTVKLVAGGYPCQPHSTNGKRQATKDKRELWPEFIRIIRQIRPEWVLVENVRGVLSSENGRYFGNILKSLAQSGYDAEWDVLPASAFGAPHKRERLFLVAYPQKTGRAGVLCGDIQSKFEAYPSWQPHQTLGTVWDIVPRLEKSLGQPCVWGNDDGTPHRVDSLAAIGEAVLPPIAEWIGRQILMIETQRNW